MGPFVYVAKDPTNQPVALNVDAAGNLLVNTNGGDAIQFTDLSGVIAAGGTWQLLSAAKTRTKLVIQNPSSATESIFVLFATSLPSGQKGLEIQPGQTQVFQAPLDSRNLYIYGATMGDAFTVWEA